MRREPRAGSRASCLSPVSARPHAPTLPQTALREGSRIMASTASIRFGDLLRRHRRAAGLTQAELAERASLSMRAINDLERGARQTPRNDTVALLATALGLAEEDRTAFEA